MKFECRILLAAIALSAGLVFRFGFATPAWAQDSPGTEVNAQADTSLGKTEELPLATTESGLPPHEYRPVLAIGEVVVSNTLIWIYDRFIREGGENPGFRVGLNSWEENLKNGFEWDDNNFGTNQFAHPYHGSIYFNAARSNGYDFWESIPFCFAGSYMWEYFYETHHATYNDWVNTSVGGVALGEMFWRLSDMVLDNTAQGSGRRWREFGGLVLNPSRGVTRMVTGEWSRVGPNPPRRFPEVMGLQFDTGTRTVGAEPASDPDTTRIFMEVSGRYGDPLNEHEKPFDSIELGAMLNFGDASVLAGLKAHGILAATELSKSENTQHVLGYFLNFDYFNTTAFEAGQQSMGAGLMSRWSKTPIGRIETQVDLNGIILGAVKSDYENYSGRGYDYGPGASAVITAALARNRSRPWLVLRHGEYWIHTLNGTDSEHFVSISRVRLEVPVTSYLGVGAQGILYLSDGDYDGLDDTSHRQPELRFYLSLPL